MMTWNRVSDVLPEQGSTILIAFSRGDVTEVRMAIYKDIGQGTPWFVYGHHQDWYSTKHVTHWMALPELPI
jgi:hypothetical protein